MRAAVVVAGMAQIHAGVDHAHQIVEQLAHAGHDEQSSAPEGGVVRPVNGGDWSKRSHPAVSARTSSSPVHRKWAPSLRWRTYR